MKKEALIFICCLNTQKQSSRQSAVVRFLAHIELWSPKTQTHTHTGKSTKY